MKCAIYVRVSTDEQVKEGFSIPAQKERLKAFCLSQGWDIVEEYIEEGWSAKNLDRPIMQRMLKDIKHKDIDIILVYRLDRLTRSVLDLYNLLQVFEKNDVSFKSATEVYDTSTAMGRLFITLVAALAQWERENLAERVKFGIEQMIDEGKKPGGHSPFGYQFDKHFNCTIIENEAAVVKKIFTWYANGYGYRTISNNLNYLKVKPRLAKEWNFNSVREILINDMYIGVYRWGSKVLYDHHPPIISKALFDSVRKRQSQKTTNSSRVGKNPLTGVLKCGTCEGYPIQGYYDKRDQKLYYRCLKCKRITWDKRILEPLFDEINNLITSKDYFISKMKGQRKDSYEDLDRIQAEIEKIKAQKEKWYDVFEDENNPIPKDVLFTKINKLNVKEQDLNMQLNELDVDEESPDEKYLRLKKVSHLTAHYHKSSGYHQRELLHSIFESVIITREKGRNKPISINYTLK
ncbi:recombinase family protein [Salipaludibacillus agaradhaerens]|uniref:Recombinase family protein n=1 Tax=Salipaludibacillus agaradhaerens TaxID=76935 RepID=A0A9Q4AZC0_SALAG|nr:recombinase family protein [Salipaludibacillus agaradhaerens]MCR6095408.1 recombinase family protein [Salipaludibacillus agaradhaerens]MCR6115033.1 recombinase family protein [Salipaludibacillus agaradhaerens]